MNAVQWLLAAALIAMPAVCMAAPYRVSGPYLEIRTGPGRGFPVFHVAEQGEVIEIVARRTDWLRVETTGRRKIEGWVREDQIEAEDVTPLGRRQWQWTIEGGDFAGASVVSTSLMWQFTPNLALGVTGKQVLGNFSDGWMALGSLRATPFPQYRVSPWVELGGGILHTSPYSTIVASRDREDRTLVTGAGVDLRLARRFTFTLAYRRHTVLTSRDNNEEIDEWNLGVSVHF